MFARIVLVFIASMLLAGCATSVVTTRHPNGTVTEERTMIYVPPARSIVVVPGHYQNIAPEIGMAHYRYTRPVRRDGTCPGVNGQLRLGDRYNCYYW